MIEITCNKTEQKKIIEALVHSNTPCLFPRTRQRCAVDPTISCNNCIQEKIKWNIVSKQKGTNE